VKKLVIAIVAVAAVWWYVSASYSYQVDHMSSSELAQFEDSKRNIGLAARGTGRALWGIVKCLSGFHCRSQEEVDADNAADRATHRTVARSSKNVPTQAETFKALSYGVIFKHPVTTCIDPDTHDGCRTLPAGIERPALQAPAAKVPEAAKRLPDGMYAFCLTGIFATQAPTTCEWAIVRPADDVLRYVSYKQ
jgi:hypothetical protein